MRKYVNIPLPEDLIKQIEKTIETVGLGYTTKTEFVKEAVRERIMTLSKYNEQEGDKDKMPQKISQLQNDIRTYINRFNDDVKQKRELHQSYAKKFREKSK